VLSEETSAAEEWVAAAIESTETTTPETIKAVKSAETTVNKEAGADTDAESGETGKTKSAGHIIHPRYSI
jgi:hypothetical protein